MDSDGFPLQPFAVIYLDQPVRHDPFQLAALVRDLYPAARDCVDGPDESDDVGVTIEGTRVIVGAFDRPMRWAIDRHLPLHSLAEQSPFDLVDATVGHTAHILVALAAAPDHRVWEARVLTAVVGGLLAQHPGAVAVEWEGWCLRRPARWRTSARLAFDKDELPVPLWIDVEARAVGPRLLAVSNGLLPFVGRELQFESHRHSEPELIEWVDRMANYVLLNSAPGQPVLKSGDTFGATAAERIRVHHEDSELAGGPVIRAVFE